MYVRVFTLIFIVLKVTYVRLLDKHHCVPFILQSPGISPLWWQLWLDSLDLSPLCHFSAPTDTCFNLGYACVGFFADSDLAGIFSLAGIIRCCWRVSTLSGVVGGYQHLGVVGGCQHYQVLLTGDAYWRCWNIMLVGGYYHCPPLLNSL